MITCVRGRNTLDACPFKNEHQEALLFICRKRILRISLSYKFARKIFLISYQEDTLNLLSLKSFKDHTYPVRDLG